MSQRYRSFRRGAAVALALALAPGCTTAGAFVCRDDSQCALAGGGVCEASGYCSGTDPSCASGRRYLDGAGDGLAERCVAPGDPPVSDDPGAPRDPLPSGVHRLVAAPQHSCALLDDGTVKCWGYNGEGQLGLGDIAHRGDGPEAEMGALLPAVALGAGRVATSLAAGGGHSCALLDDGSVKCWGYNGFGELGLGHAVHRGDDPNEMGAALPAVDLGPGRTATAIAVNLRVSCAILDTGGLKCWGHNVDGQLGQGDGETRGDEPAELGANLPPIDLAGRTARRIAVGYYHVCAVLDDDQVRCWGKNVLGQLGRGDTDRRGDAAGEMGASLLEVDLGPGRTAVDLALGEGHSCALLDDGTVKCWGQNQLGQLGQGDLVQRGDGPAELGASLAPIDLGAGRTATAIAAGRAHTCALLAGGGLKCWGYNTAGQLGLGDTQQHGDGPGEMGSHLPLVDLGIGRTAVEVAAGATHTCALLAGGAVKCWGSADRGLLGLLDGVSRGDGPGEMGDQLPPTALR